MDIQEPSVISVLTIQFFDADGDIKNTVSQNFASQIIQQNDME